MISNTQYIIIRQIQNELVYLFDIEVKYGFNKIIWTRKKGAAIHFVSEIGVIEVEEKFFHKQPYSIEIISIIPTTTEK